MEANDVAGFDQRAETHSEPARLVRVAAEEFQAVRV